MTRRLDPFFTPPEVAKALVDSLSANSPAVVLDPAAGDGALLVAAEKRWPTATFIALDIDPSHVRLLRATHPDWLVGRCDFLSPRSRASCHALRTVLGSIDLAILNPPYSARGAKTWPIVLGAEELRCGRAMAFVGTVLGVLEENAEVAALVPSSSLTSRKDAASWQAIQQLVSVEKTGDFPRGTFDRGTASTAAVRFTRPGCGVRVAPTTSRRPKSQRLAVTVRRGHTPLHTVSKARKRTGDRNHPLVHSTALVAHRVLRAGLRPSPAGALPTLRGPAVLLPRVGKPMPEKFATWGRGSVVLSDCVFGIECDSSAEMHRTLDLLLRNWRRVRNSYVGSCAPYLTVAALIGLLEELGVTASWEGAQAWRRAASIGIEAG